MELQENVLRRVHPIGMHEVISSTGLGARFNLQLLTICDQGLLVVKNKQSGIPWVLPMAMPKVGNPSLMSVAEMAIPTDIIDMKEIGNSTPRKFLYATGHEGDCDTVFAGIVVPKRAVLRSSRAVFQWVFSNQSLKELFTPDRWELPEVVSLRNAVDVARQSKLLSWGGTVH